MESSGKTLHRVTSASSLISADRAPSEFANGESGDDEGTTLRREASKRSLSRTQGAPANVATTTVSPRRSSISGPNASHIAAAAAAASQCAAVWSSAVQHSPQLRLYLLYLLSFGSNSQCDEYTPSAFTKETHAMLLRLFALLDRDGDGRFDSADLVTASEAVPRCTTYNTKLFVRLDKQRQGSLDVMAMIRIFFPHTSAKKLLSMHEGFLRPPPRQLTHWELLSAHDQTEIEEIYGYFQKLPGGGCTIDNVLLSMTSSEVYVREHAREFITMLQAHDSDHDGVLSLEDYFEMVKKNYAPFNNPAFVGSSGGGQSSSPNTSSFKSAAAMASTLNASAVVHLVPPPAVLPQPPAVLPALTGARAASEAASPSASPTRKRIGNSLTNSFFHIALPPLNPPTFQTLSAPESSTSPAMPKGKSSAASSPRGHNHGSPTGSPHSGGHKGDAQVTVVFDPAQFDHWLSRDSRCYNMSVASALPKVTSYGSTELKDAKQASAEQADQASLDAQFQLLHLQADDLRRFAYQAA